MPFTLVRGNVPLKCKALDAAELAPACVPPAFAEEPCRKPRACVIAAPGAANNGDYEAAARCAELHAVDGNLNVGGECELTADKSSIDKFSVTNRVWRAKTAESELQIKTDYIEVLEEGIERTDVELEWYQAEIAKLQKTAEEKGLTIPAELCVGTSPKAPARVEDLLSPSSQEKERRADVAAPMLQELALEEVSRRQAEGNAGWKAFEARIEQEAKFREDLEAGTLDAEIMKEAVPSQVATAKSSKGHRSRRQRSRRKKCGGDTLDVYETSAPCSDSRVDVAERRHQQTDKLGAHQKCGAGMPRNCSLPALVDVAGRLLPTLGDDAPQPQHQSLRRGRSCSVITKNASDQRLPPGWTRGVGGRVLPPTSLRWNRQHDAGEWAS